jgi:hypothetical protein
MASTHNPGGNGGWAAHAPPHWLKYAYACAYDTEAIEVARAYRKKIGAKAVRGLVRTTGLSAADKRKTPTANCIIKYEHGHTEKKLHGMEARELYCMEWLRGGSN